ncbi:single-stranded DNA-binding protein [Candidatus Saccharibacteria bacterium CPR2]|nr:single-stranded DNA-binding protein [Candidatus Saccharibacteria bacterium CPR2]
MAKGFNQVVLMGNLTRDPELRTTPKGQSVCSFSVAVNRSWSNAQGEAQDSVDYFDIVAWAKLAELVNQYLQKGRRVLVVGRLQNQTWEQDGQKRKRTEIVASDITFLDSGSGSGSSFADNDSQASSESKSKKNSADTSDVVIEDIDDKPVDLSDIPF